MEEIQAHRLMTGADAVQLYGYTEPPVTIGFLDSGIDLGHPALAAAGGTGLVKADPDRSDLTVADKTGHGTQVARIATGAALAPPSVLGISPMSPVVSLRLMNDNPGTGADARPYGYTANFAVAFLELGYLGGKILNVSTSVDGPGGPGYADFGLFVVYNGLVVVETGDGHGQTQPSALALLPFAGADPDGLAKGWLVAGAVDKTGTALAAYSRPCGNARLNCLVAPGDVVFLDRAENGDLTFKRAASTDYAAAQVSGAAAAVWRRYHYFDQDLIRQTLLGAARDLGAPGVDDVFGWGLLDVAKAMKGPSRLDWGDVAVVLPADSSSYWMNPISGAGGLDIDGGNAGGYLSLMEEHTYTGNTVIRNGALVDIHKGTKSSIALKGAARLIANGGVWSGDVDIEQGSSMFVAPFHAPGAPPPPQLVLSGTIRNDGNLMINPGVDVAFNGDFEQGPNGVLMAYLGPEPLRFAGTVKLDGTYQIHGVLPSYVPTTRLVVLDADGGVTGRFARMQHTDAITLDATLGYGANEVWLDITRLDIHRYAETSGLATAAVASAQRVEGAFDLIDRGLANDPSLLAGDLMAGAAAIQQADSQQALERTLSSLSGELHDADVAFAMMALEGGRHALDSRLDRVRDGAAFGAWSDSLGGKRSWSSFDVESSGWVMGNDLRLANGVTVGAAVSSTDSNAWNAQRGDRERNRQADGQVYAAWNVGEAGYLLGGASFGHMQRKLQRGIDLGGAVHRVGSDYTQAYAAVSMQGGHRFDIGNAVLTPYVGAVSLQLERDAFQEEGGAGFGLTGEASTLRATQALAGARLDHGWNHGSVRFDLQARAEWQQLLSQSGHIDARFNGIDAWSPIVGGDLDDNVGVFALGLGARFGRASQIQLDADLRRSGDETWSGAMLNYSTGF